MVNEFYWPKTEDFFKDMDKSVTNNLHQLPYILLSSKVANHNLYSIYLETYRIICFGFYNAGLILLGQLLEATLKEIIFVKTGKYLKGSFGKAIKHAKNNKIVDKYTLNRLELFKDLVRNPYAHRDLREIVKNIYVPTWLIQFNKEENPLKIIEKAKKEIETGKRKPILFPAEADSTIATIMKEKIDKNRAIDCAWKVFSEFEILLDTYLTLEDYSTHIKKYGSPYDVINKNAN